MEDEFPFGSFRPIFRGIWLLVSGRVIMRHPSNTSPAKVFQQSASNSWTFPRRRTESWKAPGIQ